MAHEKTWQFDMNHLFDPVGAAPPVVDSITVTPGGGGSFSVGTTYYYSVTAFVGGIETVVSKAEPYANVTTGTDSIRITWKAAPGATLYRLYRGTSSHGYASYRDVGLALTFTDINTGWSTVGNMNQVDASMTMCRMAMWYFKAFLTGQTGGATLGLWTIYGSADGVTGGMDGVDRWGSTFDPVKLTPLSGARAWLTLRSPLIRGSYFYITFDWVTVGPSVTLVLSGSAPTGGTASASPTYPTNSISTSSFFLNYANYYPAGPFRMHGQLATDGSFNIFVTRNGVRRFFGGFMGHVLANARAGDLAPFWLHMAGDYYANTGWGEGSSMSPADNATSNMLPAANNAAGVAHGLIIPAATNMPDAGDSFDGTYGDYPLWAANKAQGVRGRLQDVTLQQGGRGSPYGGSGPGTGSTHSPTAPTYMTIGLFRFPTNQRILWE